MSFLLYATKNQTLYCTMIDYCIKDINITIETKFFLYYQFIRFNFINQEVVSDKVEDLLDDLYSKIYQEYCMQVEEEYVLIPKEERNSDFVIVLTSQVLSMNHGPTKTLLDRCHILEEVLKKNVYIINTAECLSRNGEVGLFRKSTAIYLAELCNEEWLEYKGRKYAFYQCPENMPSVPIIREILEVIKTEKPYFILTIGGNSIVSDICSNVIPTIAISLAPSDKTMTRGQFQAIGRKISDKEQKWMHKHNYSKEHMIESLFTSAFTTRFYPHVDYFIDREKIDSFYSKNGEKVAAIMAGWYTHSPLNWPPSPYIHPLMVSMHFTDNMVYEIESEKINTLDNQRCRDWFRKSGKNGVGCRDGFTRYMLQKLGIETWWSGCITLTLKKI